MLRFVLGSICSECAMAFRKKYILLMTLMEYSTCQVLCSFRREICRHLYWVLVLALKNFFLLFNIFVKLNHVKSLHFLCYCYALFIHWAFWTLGLYYFCEICDFFFLAFISVNILSVPLSFSSASGTVRYDAFYGVCSMGTT